MRIQGCFGRDELGFGYDRRYTRICLVLLRKRGKRAPPCSRDLLHDINEIVMLVSTCACGRLRLLVQDEDLGDILECHCRSCQSYHAAASVHFVFAREIRVVSSRDGRDAERRPIEESSTLLGSFRGRCDYLSSLHVRRSFCRRCFSRLYSVPNETDTAKKDQEKQRIMVNVGALIDKTIPVDVVRALSKGDIIRWKPEHLPYWAKPVTESGNNDDNFSPSRSKDRPHHIGKCHCGACKYEFIAPNQTEVQHCYCALCRRHSGSLYTSWIPVQTLAQSFRWIVQGSALTTTRPTDSSRRFFCSLCGTCLAILYDWEETDDAETSWIWLSGGALDNANPPLQFERRAHIYCRYKPRWFTIPDDDLSQCSE